jgi:hypothetical protein
MVSQQRYQLPNTRNLLTQSCQEHCTLPIGPPLLLLPPPHVQRTASWGKPSNLGSQNCVPGPKPPNPLTCNRFREQLTRLMARSTATTSASTSCPTSKSSPGCFGWTQATSDLWIRHDAPSTSMKAPYFVMALTVPLTKSPIFIRVCNKSRWMRKQSLKPATLRALVSETRCAVHFDESAVLGDGSHGPLDHVANLYPSLR